MTWFSVTPNKDSLASTEPVGTHTFGVPLGWPEYQTWCLVLELIAKSEVHRILTMANSSSQPFNQPTDSGAFCTFLYKDTIPPCVIGTYAFIGRPMAQTLASIALSPGHSPPTHDLGMRLEVAWKKKHSTCDCCASSNKTPLDQEVIVCSALINILSYMAITRAVSGMHWNSDVICMVGRVWCIMRFIAF